MNYSNQTAVAVCLAITAGLNFLIYIYCFAQWLRLNRAFLAVTGKLSDYVYAASWQRPVSAGDLANIYNANNYING